MLVPDSHEFKINFIFLLSPSVKYIFLGALFKLHLSL